MMMTTTTTMSCWTTWRRIWPRRQPCRERLRRSRALEAAAGHQPTARAAAGRQTPHRCVVRVGRPFIV